ncbi:putative peptide modification system cyclase [Stenotrophomonas nitritireducens]|nr:putative peptide modification system cyclase [Stenotrophomonas nitritireducens]
MSSETDAASSDRQLKTLVLTDLCDSVALTARIGDAAAAELFRSLDVRVLQLLQRWKGRLIDRSDGMLLLFDVPVHGLGFALDYLDALAEIGKQRQLPLQARIGIHVGDVLFWRNDDDAVAAGAKPLDVEGVAKPTAARLMALARPNQILLSAVAEGLLRASQRELGERGTGLQWKSHGRWCFKGLPTPQEVFEVGVAGRAPLRAPARSSKAWRMLPLWRRPVALVAELMLVVVAVAVVWILVRPEPAIAFTERDWIVVGDLRNLTGQTVLDESLRQAFRISLEQSKYVNVLSDLKVRDTLSRMRKDPEKVLVDRAVASEVALRDGARAVVLPLVSEVGGRLRVTVEIVDPVTQNTVYTEYADGRGLDSALASVDQVTARLRGRLGEAIASIGRDSRPLPEVSTRDLDALRAYAMGQEAFGKGQYKQALGLYEHAVSLDKDFALAHLGMLRALNATEQLPKGLLSLQKTQAMTSRLSPREAMYMQAWEVQINNPGDAYQKWRQMSDLYPDFYAAAANVGYALEMENRYQEALPYIRRASESRYEFAPLSQEALGRMSLALGNYGDAATAFSRASESGLVTAAVWQANLNAAQGNFQEAERLWPRDTKLAAPHFDHVSHFLDKGELQAASLEAQRLLQALPTDGSRFRQGQIQLAVLQWMSGNRRGALGITRNIVRDSMVALDGAAGLTARGEAITAAYGAILAQRLGDHELARQLIVRLEQSPQIVAMQPVGGFLQVLKARESMASGNAGLALEGLVSTLGQHESFQLREALMEAYVAEGKPEAALRQADWMVSHRGWAYVEHGGCGWCGQSLNIADSNLARLRKIELLAQLGRREAALKELQSFDAYWKNRTLPDYLRVRREALPSTFS